LGQYHEAVRIEGVKEPMKYTVVIEKAPSNYAAYVPDVPDLPGCVATGSTRDAVLAEIREAIAFHIESLREHGEPVPEPQSTAEVVDVGVTTAG
jgi:predicted RNase H-like HicB family nuclease